MAGLIHFLNPDNINDTPVSAANPLPTVAAGGSPGNPNGNPSAPFTGQQTASTAAAALPNHALVNGIAIQALQTNTGVVFVGAAGVTASTGYPLSAGQQVSFGVTNAAAVFVLGQNASDVVAFAGS
jgi:hypothetical protein